MSQHLQPRQLPGHPVPVELLLAAAAGHGGQPGHHRARGGEEGGCRADMATWSHRYIGHNCSVSITITCEGGETHDHEEAANGRHGGEADGVARPGHGEGEQLPGNLVSRDSVSSIFAQYS